MTESIVDKALKKVAEDAHERLVSGMNVPCIHLNCIFEDVLISLPYTAPMLGKKGSYNFASDSDKNILNPELYASKENPCLVYGLGVNTDSQFESRMAKYCSVHAFDCTTSVKSPSVINQPFKFHQICIGDPIKLDEQTEGIAITNPNPGRPLHFKHLEQVMAELGHKIDIMKFDIEGGEWTLLEYILECPQSAPHQLLFEMHTQGANRQWVPSSIVKNKSKQAVNQKFLCLHDMGRLLCLE